MVGVLLGSCLGGCVHAPVPTGLSTPAMTSASSSAPSSAPSSVRGASRWTPASWADLPGFEDDALHEAWNAWVKSCERPPTEFVRLCRDVRPLSLGTGQEQRAWMRERLQPYRIEAQQGSGQGLLTGYYEPVLEATREPGDGFNYPVFGPPTHIAALQKSGKPWYTRQEIDTRPEARMALRGRELLWLSTPADALTVQIQGSGRVHVREADGTQRWVRLSFAGSNNHPYQSPGRWLLEQRAVQDASWPGIKAWIAQNPQRVDELLWSNPRVVFFREDRLSELDAAFGPTGAQGVALTPGRSIAVDPQSIPYGSPVWLASRGPTTTLQKLVLAQDTGSAITGAVRADYFAGWGAQAAELAGRLKQPLQLWVLWPK